jgi:hypothetical protein
MELTLEEFGCFNLKSKSQILSFKANYVSSICVGKSELQLYVMGNNYYVKQVCRSSGLLEKIDPIIKPDTLYLFAKDNDLSAILPD